MANADGSKRIESSTGDAVAGTSATPARPKTPAEERAEEVRGSGDPDAIAQSIEQTREELAETLDAIVDRVSPKKVAKRTTKRVGDEVKASAHDAVEKVKEAAGSVKESAVHASEQVKDKAGEAAASVREHAASAGEQVKGATDSVKDKVSGGSTVVAPASPPYADAATSGAGLGVTSSGTGVGAALAAAGNPELPTPPLHTTTPVGTTGVTAARPADTTGMQTYTLPDPQLSREIVAALGGVAAVLLLVLLRRKR